MFEITGHVNMNSMMRFEIQIYYDFMNYVVPSKIILGILIYGVCTNKYLAI